MISSSDPSQLLTLERWSLYRTDVSKPISLNCILLTGKGVREYDPL